MKKLVETSLVGGALRERTSDFVPIEGAAGGGVEHVVKAALTGVLIHSNHIVGGSKRWVWNGGSTRV